MISELKINNYKSLQQTEPLSIGRFNVLIGENGCGKSNLLEAITFAAAAEANKLDNEFLKSRGIRVTEPRLMRSAFSDENLDKPINIDVSFENATSKESYTLTNDNQSYPKWTRIRDEFFEITDLWQKLYETNQLYDNLKNEKRLPLELQLKGVSYPKNMAKIEKKISRLENMKKMEDDFLTLIAVTYFDGNKENAQKYLLSNKSISNNKRDLKNFIIYSPENTALRAFNRDGRSQIEPLGINGEGLLDLLKVIQDKSLSQWNEIHTCLQLFDWYSEFNIPKPKHTGMLAVAMSRRMNITDRYLTMDFDQRSANEGFLFVLFYIALMVSDDTPKIFAIDNIDTSLNPKLCTKLIKELVRLSKKYDKQVFVTTHNPAILDGIDLGDDEQRLFVVSRNRIGHTRFKRIALENKPKSYDDEELKLSEAFLQGYLGGLPKGF